ncbi:DUF1566 domain-containing protein, partial [Candidatus Auribacterota bacterium]
RGKAYGENDLADNGNNTVTDRATGLMWMRTDSGKPMTWKEALKYSDKLKYAGYDDWRLPNVKELQYLVDYTRSPDTANSPAIDPVFQTTSITNEAGEKDYPHFWTSTTHLDGPVPGKNAAYIAFGRAMGQMNGKIMDVHGAGAQRSDPKTGTAQIGHGPQGDARRTHNYVRCVRGGDIKKRTSEPPKDISKYPYNIKAHSSQRSGNREMNIPQPPQRNTRDIPGQRGRHPAGFVSRLDTNRDGKVSRSEFDGPPDRFDHHDRDRDGYLTEAEAPSHPPPHNMRRGR